MRVCPTTNLSPRLCIAFTSILQLPYTTVARGPKRCQNTKNKYEVIHRPVNNWQVALSVCASNCSKSSHWSSNWPLSTPVDRTLTSQYRLPSSQITSYIIHMPCQSSPTHHQRPSYLAHHTLPPLIHWRMLFDTFGSSSSHCAPKQMLRVPKCCKS